ncbi:hypothetical protein QR680_009746 [Steinernema hermaphroditum]|uniref:BROMI C-terminal Rab TBC-like domain-containing protein n=1 Tax=Steinernema hermaphroditum TaxID=289476 RepID=A0AA39IN90_9BILA|nr:hypothetical protein QR680_009746 [Steinernema hermaphroditum]
MASPVKRNLEPPESTEMDAVFLIEEDSFSAEELGEWFNLMIEQNAQLMASPAILNYELGERLTRQLFAMCNKLRIPPEAKINSALILNKYLNTLKLKASNLLLNESNIETRRQLHEQVRTRMLRHMPMRMVSAMQIASKMFTYRYTPALQEFKKYLEAVDQPYLLEELVASEMTVLEAIDFDINNTNSPVAFLETVFQMFVMIHAKKKEFNAQKYWKASLQVLEPSLQHLKCDYLLLSCGILCVPVARLAGKDKLCEMAKELSNLTSLDQDHIISAANGIFHMIRRTQQKDENKHFVASKLDQTMWSMIDEGCERRRMARKRPAEDCGSRTDISMATRVPSTSPLGAAATEARMEDRQIEELIWRFTETGDGRDLFNYLVQQTLEECGSEIDMLLGRNGLQSRQMTASSSGNRLSNTDVRMMQRRLRAVADQVANTEKFRSLKQKILRDTTLTAQCIADRPDSSSLGLSTVTEGDDTLGEEQVENLGQSTRFPMESEVQKAMDEMVNLQLTDSFRLRSVRRILSMSTFSIAKSGGIEKFFAEFGSVLSSRHLTEDIFAFSVKLFNSEDSALVQRIFCAVMDSSDAVPSDYRLKYCALALQMFKVCPTVWKRCPSQHTAPMIDSTMRLLNRTKDLSSLSEENVLAALAAMDPHSNWIRSWMQPTSYRQFMREGMEIMLRRIAGFLSNNTNLSQERPHFAGFYSTSELTTMLTISYSTIALLSLQYPDFFAPSPDLFELILKASTTAIRRNFRIDRGSHVSKALTTVLNDISCVQTSAEALRSMLPTVINLRSVVNVRIVLNILQFSEAPLDEETLNQLVPMVNRYLNFKQVVVRNDVIRILDLALDKCLVSSILPLLSRDLLLKHLDLSNPTHCSVLFRLGLPSEIPIAELLDSPALWRYGAPLSPMSMTEYRIFARLLCSWLLDPSSEFPSPNILILMCQPFLIVEVLNSSDFSSFFDLQFEEISRSRGASLLTKLALLTANADFSMELRRSQNFLSRVHQICSNKHFPFYDEATEASLLLLKSMVIGSSDEKKDLKWPHLPKKSSEVVPLLYQTISESTSPEGFNDEQFYSNPLAYLLELWRTTGISHGSVLEAMVKVFRQFSPTEEAADFQPCGQDWTPLFDYVQHRLRLLSNNRKIVRRISQSLLVPYALDDSGRTDWILGVLFVLSRFDRSTTNDLSRLLSVNPSVSTLWPSFHTPLTFSANVHTEVLPMVEDILNSAEFSVVRNCLLVGKVPTSQLLTFFLNQAYLSVLDWKGVSDYVVLSLIGGANFQANHFCAVLFSMKDDLLRIVNSGDLGSHLVTHPHLDSSAISTLYGFVFKIAEKTHSFQKET